MALYNWSGYTEKGKTAQGMMDASSLREAKLKLRSQGVFVSTITEEVSSPTQNVRDLSVKRFFERVRLEDITVMTRQLSTLVGASIPLVDALSALYEQTESPGMKRTVAKVRDSIEGAEDFDGDKYRAMMEEGLAGILTETEAFDVEIDKDGEVSTLKCDGFMLTFNETQFIDFALPILEEAKTDAALKNIIIAKTREYFDFSLNIYGEDFFKQPGMDNPYGEIDEFINEIETDYEVTIANIITELQTQRERSDKETFVVINKIGLDSDGEMRYWEMDLDLNVEALEELESAAVEGIDGAVGPDMSNPEGIKGVTVSMEYVINSINEDLTFTDYSTVAETGVDIVALAENPESPEAQQLMMQIMGAAMQEMGTNPLLQILSQSMGAY